ncbi:MAG: IS3 family transposase [Nitrospirales bacterium]|nr:IS3 family transposase [Nitrospirales bacterium]
MRLLDAQYLITLYGSRRMTVWLQTQGYPINRKRIQRLMRLMGLEGVAPCPRPPPRIRLIRAIPIYSGCLGGAAQSGLVCGHHLCPDGCQFYVFGRYHGLV